MANTVTLTDQYSPCQFRPRQRVRKGGAAMSQGGASLSSSSSPPPPSLSSLLAHCDHLSSSVAIDVVILVIVLAACGCLFTPYFAFIAAEAAQVVPAALYLLGEMVIQAPIAYASATLFMFAALLVSYEILQYKLRKCDNPDCRGLSKAMKLDIQLETEDCVKSSPTNELQLWNRGHIIGPGHDQRELEAELRRMAPPNGRAVLICRAPCGCPAARFEASGSKKAVRRSKK